MQAILCDNCGKPGKGAADMAGWRKVARFTVKESGMPPNPLLAMMGRGGGEGPQLEVEKEHDLCSDACLLAFVKAGWEPSFTNMDIDDLTPEAFATPVEPPQEPEA